MKLSAALQALQASKPIKPTMLLLHETELKNFYPARQKEPLYGLLKNFETNE